MTPADTKPTAHPCSDFCPFVACAECPYRPDVTDAARRWVQDTLTSEIP